MNVKSDEERKSKVLKVRLNDSEFAKLNSQNGDLDFIRITGMRCVCL